MKVIFIEAKFGHAIGAIGEISDSLASTMVKLGIVKAYEGEPEKVKPKKETILKAVIDTDTIENAAL